MKIFLLSKAPFLIESKYRGKQNTFQEMFLRKQTNTLYVNLNNKQGDIYICIYVYIYVYVNVYIYTYIYISIYRYIYKYIDIDLFNECNALFWST